MQIPAHVHETIAPSGITDAIKTAETAVKMILSVFNGIFLLCKISIYIVARKTGKVKGKTGSEAFYAAGSGYENRNGKFFRLFFRERNRRGLFFYF